MVRQVCQLLVEDPFGWIPDQNGTIVHHHTAIALARRNGRWCFTVGMVPVGFFDNWRLNRAYKAMYEERAKRQMAARAERDFNEALADQQRRLAAYEASR